jgi:acetyl esterase/lipase
VLDLAGDYPSRREFADGYYLDAAMVADDLAQYCPPGIDRADPRLSPLRQTEMSGLPPAIIHAAEFDPFRDEAMAYANALRASGGAAALTLHDGMIHIFYAFARLIPYGATALAAMGRELGERLPALH